MKPKLNIYWFLYKILRQVVAYGWLARDCGGTEDADVYEARSFFSIVDSQSVSLKLGIQTKKIKK